MRNLVEQCLFFLHGIWKYRWLVLGVAWVICVVGWAYVLKLPDEFEASARVQVDTQSMLRPVLRGLAFDVDDTWKIELVTRTLLSRPNVEKIVRKSDLDLGVTDDRGFDALIARLQRSIRLRGGSRDDIYGITYSDPNPQAARDVVQAALDIFLENALGETKGGANTAKKFIDRQIDGYERRLLDAETKLQEFKRQNLGLMPSESGNYYQRMQVAEAELKAAVLELRQAEQRRDSLERQVGGEEPTFGIGGTASSQLGNGASGTGQRAGSTEPSYGPRIRVLEERLDQLLLSYTERHPEVIALREALARLRDQRRMSLAARASLVNPDQRRQVPVEQNPIYQHLRIALGQEELNIVALQVRVDELRKDHEELKEFVDAVPEVEARLASLNRDYEVTKKNYRELLARRETVRFTQEVDETTDKFQFKIVEPPRVPRKPTGPNRVLYFSAVMVSAIGSGVGLALVLSQLWPTFNSGRRVTDSTGIPVLGTVEFLVPASMRRRALLGTLAYIGLGGLLFSVYSGLVVQASRGSSFLDII